MLAGFLADCHSDAAWNCRDIIFIATQTREQWRILKGWCSRFWVEWIRKLWSLLMVAWLFKNGRFVQDVTQVTVLATILSDQSVVCSVLTPPFSIGSARLEPWPRWYQVPGITHNFSQRKTKNKSSWVEPCCTMQWKRPRYAAMHHQRKGRGRLQASKHGCKLCKTENT